MKLDEPLEEALRSAEPVNQLRSAVLQLISEGKDPATILAMLEDARRELRHAGRDADEDAIMDVTDFLTGWCSPHMKLPPNQSEVSGGTKLP